jgi:anti-sigma regulatory factor (Ser/Thr protein kinase)
MEAAVHVRLEGGLSAARDARCAVRDGLAGRVDDDVLEDMQLLVSEVVTNGIRHGSGRIDLEVLLNGDRAVVRCIDEGSGFEPGEPKPHDDRTGGYGLVLVDRLAKSWGVTPGSGSCVWFELAT